MSRLEALFANQNYQIAGDAELHFHNAVNVIFQMPGFYVETERHTSDGSMDMVNFSSASRKIEAWQVVER